MMPIRAIGRWVYRLYVAALVGGVAIAAGLALFPPVATAVHTAGFVVQVLPTPVPVQRTLAPQPKHFITTYQTADGRTNDADVYVIADGKRRAGVLVFLGANAAGATDPDVVNLGEALARAGFAVMYHWSSTLGEDADIAASEIDTLVAAFQHLGRQDFVDPDRIGLAGFSVGASLALVAAADPRIAHQVAFVNAFGGYYDAGDLLVQIAARRTLYAADVEEWEVDPLTSRVFINEITENVPDPARREMLRSAAMAGEPLAVPAASPQEDVVLALLGDDLTLVDARNLYAQLPDAYHQQAKAVSPSAHIPGLHPDTAIRVMHDRGDMLIPVGESRRLTNALQQRPIAAPVRYTETDIFRHVRPDSETDLPALIKGAAQLFRHMYWVIALAR